MSYSLFYHNEQEVLDKELMNEWINGIKSTVLKATCCMLPILALLNSNGTFSWNYHSKYCHPVEMLERSLKFRIWEQRDKVTSKGTCWGLKYWWSSFVRIEGIWRRLVKVKKERLIPAKLWMRLNAFYSESNGQTMKCSWLLKEGVTHWSHRQACVQEMLLNNWGWYQTGSQKETHGWHS